MREGALQQDDDAALTVRMIEAHLRIHGRAREYTNVLLQMESQLGPRHPLSSIRSLDMLCGLTSCENKATSHALLGWCVRALFVGCLRQQIPLDSTFPATKAACIEALHERQIDRP